MDLFFVRHGLAVDKAIPDMTRPLTREGVRRTRKVAEFLKSHGVYWEMLLTSPLVRALETAHVLQDAGLSKQLEIFAPLAPGGDFRLFQDWLNEQEPKSTAALVGHRPDLGLWVEQLVYGQASGKLVLKKSGVARVLWEPDQAELLWLLTPGLMEA
ncbi:phosphohistidine phosphatase SixA [Anthocerotibacter panamensis]|uniref:phosphohistidine phosphatase SixA n=1 Tax=Anthocerotibacter panamensis TaxID=2857077 RepID=UPI001C402054|nr:phosphohistidine phosphatase SixA [Anthocerotibacter panamensis]